ncbi:MAG: hypothetical protein IJZ42_12105 [Lachnospiraceae bacterium]|nr:hypothetical protein [Lachnospiraceae bacterium]
MLQILLVMFWLLLVPFGCGLLLTCKLPKEQHRFEIVLLNGYLVMIALFQCLYLCFVLAGSTSLKCLALIFGIAIVVYSGVSALLGRGVIKDCISSIKNKEALGIKLFFGCVVAVQLVMRLLQQVSDGDDAFYIATAAISVSNGTMNYMQPYTGFVTYDLDLRHAFSAAPIWLAFLSKVTMIRPVMMAHSILSLVLIALHYSIVVNLGGVLFKDKKKEKYLFACLVGLFNVYGYVSIYTAQTFFLTRTWQGKSIFANLFLPVLLLLLLWFGEIKQKEKVTNYYYLFAGIIMFAGTAMTTMASFILPMVFMLGMIFLAICQKRPSMLLKGMISCVPAGIVGILYLMA